MRCVIACSSVGCRPSAARLKGTREVATALNEADGVFQGGGVKGIGLVGALLEFHERGFTRWRSVAGTSAGAIIAALLAVGRTPTDAAELVAAAPYERFLDAGRAGRLLGGGWNLLVHRGLARGRYFRDWLDAELGGAAFAAVREDGESRLKVIAADVTNRELLVLPDDLPLYGLHADETRIADAVRMSMSIPYLFEPVALTSLATGKRAAIVDGGIVSNFPVWLFDVDNPALPRPTFGFRLRGGRGVGEEPQRLARRLGWPVALGLDVLHTASDAFDKRFLSHSSRVRSLAVDAGDVSTTDFDLTAAQRRLLVDSGRHAAARFLDGFSLEEYVNGYGRRLAAAAVVPRQ